MDESPAQGLLALFLGYAALLATPGPNMLAVGGIAATRGFARALPICLGLSAGAAFLAAAAGLLAAAVEGRGDDAAWRVGGAALLTLVALGHARSGDDGSGRDGATARGLDFGAGFCTAATNPLTAVFFAAQSAVAPLGGAALGGVVAMALVFYVGMAALMANPVARGAALRWRRPIRLVSAGALLFSAGTMLRPVLLG